MRKWKETSKEYAINEYGNKVPFKISEQKPFLTFKDWIDYIFRFIGIVGIGLPLWLFYQSRKDNFNKEQTLLKIDLYSSASIALHTILEKPVSTAEFQMQRDKILYSVFPKLDILNLPPKSSSFAEAEQKIKYLILAYEITCLLEETCYDFDHAALSILINQKENNLYDKEFQPFQTSKGIPLKDSIASCIVRFGALYSNEQSLIDSQIIHFKKFTKISELADDFSLKLFFSLRNSNNNIDKQTRIKLREQLKLYEANAFPTTSTCQSFYNELLKQQVPIFDSLMKNSLFEQ